MFLFFDLRYNNITGKLEISVVGSKEFNVSPNRYGNSF